MRTPETIYTKQTSLRFLKKDGQIHYFLSKWDEDGLNFGIIDTGILKDEQHLKELQSLGNVKT